MRKVVSLSCVFLLFLLAGCGGGGDGVPKKDVVPPSTVSFYAYDFTKASVYTIPAVKVATGEHCHVYLARGQEANVDNSAVLGLVDRFDHYIYPGVRAGFGVEPDVDGDPRIYILLLDIVDGSPSGSYIAGYFDPYNEYEKSIAPDSNEKEIFFMDVSEGNPSSSTFRNVLAHEFQHMIHWEQKTNRQGLFDATWLDEAMSEIAPYYAFPGFAGNYSRVYTFESEDNRSDSLTAWNGDLADYAVVYMWAQYFVDRFPNTPFKSILANDQTGIPSVQKYLNSLPSTPRFDYVFRDWSIAVFSGRNESLTDNAAWAYKTIDTWEGYHEGYMLPGIFTPAYQNVDTLPSLAPWSIAFYWYASSSPGPSLTWEAGPAPAPRASFYDWDTGGALTYDMESGKAYLYDNAAILILQNAGNVATWAPEAPIAALAGPPPGVLTPAAKLRAASDSAATMSLSAAKGEPTPVCVHDFLASRAREFHRKTVERGNAP